MKFHEIFNGFKSLKFWESVLLHLWRAITATRFSLKPHSMLTLWEMLAICLGTNTWRANSPKITNLWTLPPHCLQLQTTWNLGQNLWKDYVYKDTKPDRIITCTVLYFLVSNAHSTSSWSEILTLGSILTLILPRSRTGTEWFYTSTSNKRAARPKLYTKSLTRGLKLMYSRFTLVRISIKL